MRVVRDGGTDCAAFQLEAAHEADADVPGGAMTFDDDEFKNIAPDVRHDFAVLDFWSGDDFLRHDLVRDYFDDADFLRARCGDDEVPRFVTEVHGAAGQRHARNRFTQIFSIFGDEHAFL